MSHLPFSQIPPFRVTAIVTVATMKIWTMLKGTSRALVLRRGLQFPYEVGFDDCSEKSTRGIIDASVIRDKLDAFMGMHSIDNVIYSTNP